jgi:hypothetical protein
MIHVAELVAALAHLSIRGKNAVHRAFGAEVMPLVEERRVHLGGRKVDEASLMENLEYVLAFLRRERAWR